MILGLYYEEIIGLPDWPFYCLLTTPDYTINYTATPQVTLVNYCPLTTPNYAITYTVTPTFTTTNYCPLTTPDYSFLTPP